LLKRKKKKKAEVSIFLGIQGAAMCGGEREKVNPVLLLKVLINKRGLRSLNLATLFHH
jgi:hypothetical protein